MGHQNDKVVIENAMESLLSEVCTFNIILKFWKKASKSFEAKIAGEHCLTQESFVKYVREAYEVKSSHCLEEMWILQKAGPLDRKIEWIKEANGRIKIHVPDSYKEFLLKKSETKGKQLFEDPSYE